MNFDISGIRSSGIGLTSFSADLRADSANATTQSSRIPLGDGIDLPQHGVFDLDQIISKDGGKQSTTVTCPAGTTPVATQDGQTMTVTCEKNVKKKDATSKPPSPAPVID